MKSFFKRYRNTISLLAVIGLAVAVSMFSLSVGVQTSSALASGLMIVGLWQLSQFAMSKRSGVCFETVLTPEQVAEFGQILEDLKGYSGLLSDLNKNRNLLPKLKNLDDLESRIQQLQRASLTQKGVSVRPGEVSDGCAEFFGSLAIVGAHQQRKMEGKNLDGLVARSCKVLGIEARSALTSSDIPLPVAYSGEVVALVGMYSTARKYGTVYPLGGASVKLPKLTTDPTFGLIAGSGTVTEKSPAVGWVTFTPEKFGGLIRIPSEIDEDSIVNLGKFVAEYAARQMAYVEDWQFWRSTGAASLINGTAKGLVTTVVDDSKTTTSTGLGSPSEFTITHFRNLRGVPDASALRQGAYYLHPSFEPLLASFNTAGARPYNPNSQIQGSGSQPFQIGPTLDGFPVYWIDVLPVYTTADALSTVHVLFGNAKFQYLGVRGQMRFDTSFEAAFTTDEILVRALERLTTGKMATGCMGGLITAAS